MKDIAKFRVAPGKRVDLERLDADWKPESLDRDQAEDRTAELVERLRDLQHLMYAQDRHSLLIVLQGRDAAGKDGTIRKVFGPMNPQGCRVTSFKVPTAEELEHDFLWRCHKATPRRGEVAIFNRSHYEDVLVVRVRGLVPKSVWRARYEHINAFERLLADSGTTILKFFLHIDREEQLERFGKRIENPKKNWKISDADYSERPLWDDYTAAYEEAFRRCSTDHAPWFVIPANRKWARNLAIAEITVEALEKLKMRFPKPQVDMDEIRRKYHEAANDHA
ncbi:MAG TPA: polyphosphate kinase 2 family protein [Chondromyces sp.]|nr:polyphosphate kinase 2 family protein [Chondromyces sp.]